MNSHLGPMAHNKPQPEFFIDKSAKTKPFGEREREREDYH
jgi:hypothetical protein